MSPAGRAGAAGTRVAAIAIELLDGLAYGVLLLVLSSGLALIFGLRGVVNFAHGAIYMFAAYVSYSFEKLIGFWPALIITPIALAVIGVVVDRFGLRYLSKRDAMDLVVLTFGLTLVIQDLVQTVWGTQPISVGEPNGLGGVVTIDGSSYPTYRIFVICAGIAAGLGLALWLKFSTAGLYVRAASTRRDVASAMGVNVDQVSAVVVSLGFALAGFAGVLAGPYLTLTTTMGTDILIITFIVVIVGGLGSITGAMITAVVLGELNSLTSVSIPSIAPYVPYFLMLLVLVWRPQGIAGSRLA